MTKIVIWAQSECRSTMALYREVKRQAGAPVAVVVRRDASGMAAQRLRERLGQAPGAFADVVDAYWDGHEASGRGILSANSEPGTVHVFSGYQTSAAVRALIALARSRQLKTVVYDEAPCPMCTGIKASAKRLYYRFVLPWKVRATARTADIFLNASGRSGIRELIRLGWPESRIVPFGYATPFGRGVDSLPPKVVDIAGSQLHSLRILHTGMESSHRGVNTLRRAVAVLERRGIKVEVRYTGGNVPASEMPRMYGWADVFVACGICEPWGMRVNDAIHAGLPVIVSSGMGAEWLVDMFGCGCVFKKGNAHELATILMRFSLDGQFRANLISSVSKAHEMWSPEARAKTFLSVISG